MSLSLEEALVEAIAEKVTQRIIEKWNSQSDRPKVVPRLLTVCEAGQYLGRSQRSVEHLIADKSLRVVRTGKRVHLDRKDLDYWIEQNKY